MRKKSDSKIVKEKNQKMDFDKPEEIEKNENQEYLYDKKEIEYCNRIELLSLVISFEEFADNLDAIDVKEYSKKIEEQRSIADNQISA